MPFGDRDDREDVDASLALLSAEEADDAAADRRLRPAEDPEEEPEHRSTLLTVTPYILGNEFCERLAYYGCVRVSLSAYCQTTSLAVIKLSIRMSTHACGLYKSQGLVCSRKSCHTKRKDQRDTLLDGTLFAWALTRLRRLREACSKGLERARSWARRRNFFPLRNRLATNLITYLRQEMGEAPAFSAIMVQLFEGTCYMTPLLGAWLADSHWGRYKTILVFSSIYMLVRRCHKLFGFTLTFTLTLTQTPTLTLTLPDADPNLDPDPNPYPNHTLLFVQAESCNARLWDDHLSFIRFWVSALLVR